MSLLGDRLDVNAQDLEQDGSDGLRLGMRLSWELMSLLGDRLDVNAQDTG